MDEPQFSFIAYIQRITTTVDGGWRLTLDLDSTAGSILTDLNQFRDGTFQVAMIPITHTDNNG